MINGKKVLALIPARGGSKGLPGKNIRPLLGKPLINWSIETALNSRYIDEVVVSTDSLEIAEVAIEAGARVPFVRPEDLSTDKSTTVDVALHALAELKNLNGNEYDLIVLLEPTSPIRKPSDIEKMIEKMNLEWFSFDGIISLGEVREHPCYMKKIVGNRFVELLQESPSTTRRQDNEPVYFPYGLAYIVKCSTLLSEKTFYPRNCTHYTIAPNQCYEIDSIQDFYFVESLIAKNVN